MQIGSIWPDEANAIFTTGLCSDCVFENTDPSRLDDESKCFLHIDIIAPWIGNPGGSSAQCMHISANAWRG